jgi:hypothetical protein
MSAQEKIRTPDSERKARKSYIKLIIAMVIVPFIFFFGMLAFTFAAESPNEYEFCTGSFEKSKRLAHQVNFTAPAPLIKPCFTKTTKLIATGVAFTLLILVLIATWFESQYSDVALWHAQKNNRSAWYFIIFSTSVVGAYLYRRMFNLKFIE